MKVSLTQEPKLKKTYYVSLEISHSEWVALDRDVNMLSETFNQRASVEVPQLYNLVARVVQRIKIDG